MELSHKKAENIETINEEAQKGQTPTLKNLPKQVGRSKCDKMNRE